MTLNTHLSTVIFIGRSGSGKGTQASLMVDYLKNLNNTPVLYLETGQRFREFITGTSLASTLAKEIMLKGELQPSFLSAWMWSNELLDKLTGTEHLVIDGSPRKLSEAVMLTDALKFYGRGRPTVVYLNVARTWAKDRMLERGRGDDKNILDIEKRLDWFDSDVAPAVEFFRTNDYFNFLDINGENDIETVHQDIIAGI